MQKILGSSAARSHLSSWTSALRASCAIALVIVAASSAAQAQPADKKGDKPTTGKIKVYDFSGDTIEGDLIRPEGTTVDARDFAKHSSLITIRKDFIKEIIKSAEDL
jgi:hypothetical protein